MIFEGTIVITDPCYFIKDEDWNEKVYREGDLSHLGFGPYICRDTVYGDWSCTVYHGDENMEDNLEEIFESYDWRGLAYLTKYSEPIGKFCADAGMVAVVLLSDIEKYNPEAVKELKAKPHIATIIEDYSGYVEDYEFNNKHVVIIGQDFFTLQD